MWLHLCQDSSRSKRQKSQLHTAAAKRDFNEAFNHNDQTGQGFKAPNPPPAPPISQQGSLRLCWLSALCSQWLQKPSLTGCVPRSPCSLAAFHWVLRLHLSQSQWSQEWPDEWPGLSHTKAHKLWAEQAWALSEPGRMHSEQPEPGPRLPRPLFPACHPTSRLCHITRCSKPQCSQYYWSGPPTAWQHLTFSAGSFLNT